MKFLSLCSGIEAASVAFKPLGWKAVGFAEIDPFASAVLAHRYPEVPNLGDISRFREWPEEVFVDSDIVVGGPPCQAFSVAGARAGLSDARGNLTLTYAELIDHADDVRSRRGRTPVVALYENVPGILSDKTNAFGCLLAALAGEDEPIVVKKWPRAGVVDGGRRRVVWATLDAQYFGVAQRRRRVFVLAVPCELVERLGARADPAEILSIGQCLRGNTPAREGARKGAAAGFIRGADGGSDVEAFGGNNTAGPIDVATARNACASDSGTNRTPSVHINAGAVVFQPRHYSGRERMGGEPSEVCHTLSAQAGQGDSSPHVAYTTKLHNTGSNGWGIQEEVTHALDCAQGVAVAVALRGREGGATAELGDEVQNCLRASSGGGDKPHVLHAMQVRRLTPTEAERLMGFPDGYTAIPWRKKPASECPDGPRYKALGNSWAVTVVSWIGRRIQEAINGNS